MKFQPRKHADNPNRKGLRPIPQVFVFNLHNASFIINCSHTYTHEGRKSKYEG